jgi:phosphatidylglycerol:prolipoprotein diacylglycerol transferase
MNGGYSALLLAGIGVTLWWWSRLARRDERLLMIYVAALVGAFVGAKVVYLAAEGWMYWDSPDRWRIWATGKTILGALLGGYASVELAKKTLGFRQATGDLFALVAPVGIILGRVGCLLHGCCLGRECAAPHWWTLRDAHGTERWPAVPVEIAFNVAMLGVFIALRVPGFGFRVPTSGRTRNSKPGPLLPGQHFHLYLIAYGLFRFAHEYLRATPRLAADFTGYQAAALGCVALGVWGFMHRAGWRQSQGGA